MIRSRQLLAFLAVLLISLISLFGFQKQGYIPPPVPPDFPLPDDPPDILIDPFDPITDLPTPWEIDFPPEDPFDDPFSDPLPPPPDPWSLEDPFPDIPSFLTGQNHGYSIPGPNVAPASQSRKSADATNLLTKLMPFPMRLPFHPAPTSNRAAPTRRVCDAATATKLIIPENKKNTIAFVDTCPYRVSMHLQVGNTPVGAAGTPDGRFALVTVAGTSSVAVVDINARSVVGTIALPPLDGGPAQPSSIAILPDGSRAYVTDHVNNPGSAVYVIDIPSRTVTGMVRVDGFPSSIAATPDGSQVWVPSRGYNTVTVIDTQTNTIAVRLSGISEPTGIAFLPTGTRAYVAAGVETGGYVQVYDTANYAPLMQIPVGNLPHVVAITPSGHYAFVTNALSGTISQIDTLTNTVTRTIKTGYHPYGITFIR